MVTDRGLHRIDPAANRLVASVPIGTATVEPAGLAVSAGAVWVTTGGQVVRVDPARVPG